MMDGMDVDSADEYIKRRSAEDPNFRAAYQHEAAHLKANYLYDYDCQLNTDCPLYPNPNT